MKYGAHIFLWTNRRTSAELPLFEQSKDLGLDVLEIAVGDDVEFDATAVLRTSQNIAKIRKQFKIIQQNKQKNHKGARLLGKKFC